MSIARISAAILDLQAALADKVGHPAPMTTIALASKRDGDILKAAIRPDDNVVLVDHTPPDEIQIAGVVVRWPAH